jgi:hypothetical protein
MMKTFRWRMALAALLASMTMAVPLVVATAGGGGTALAAPTCSFSCVPGNGTGVGLDTRTGINIWGEIDGTKLPPFTFPGGFCHLLKLLCMPAIVVGHPGPEPGMS